MKIGTLERLNSGEYFLSDSDTESIGIGIEIQNIYVYIQKNNNNIQISCHKNNTGLNNPISSMVVSQDSASQQQNFEINYPTLKRKI